MVKLITPNTELIQRMSQDIQNRRSFSKVVSTFANPNAYLPVIALEAFVESGRTYQAYKRGGFDEARERITEEFSGALFWMGGIPFCNWVSNKLGRKFLKLPKDNFQIPKDNVRNPLANYLAQKVTSAGKPIKQSTIARFKVIQVISSVLITNAFIGFVVPKMNQAITRWYHKNRNAQAIIENAEAKKQEQEELELMVQAADTKPKEPLMKKFMDSAKQNNNNTTFTGNPQMLLNIANAFENNRNVKLLSVDAGTASGRMISARNNDERCEIAIRDLGSIYFYMFNAPNITRWMNKAQQNGRGTRLDPTSTKYASDYINTILKDPQNATLKFEDLKEGLLGKADVNIPESIKNQIKDGIIKLDDFNNILNDAIQNTEERTHLSEIAQKMSTLQPKLKNETAILTSGQVEDIFKGGAINDPDFLKEVYRLAMDDSFLKDFLFVKQSKIDTIKDDLTYFVESIFNKSEKEYKGEITTELVEKVVKSNLHKNLLNVGTGFAISALFLSTIIPKCQYMFTKWRTGKNEFPGTRDVDKKLGLKPQSAN